MRRVFLSSALAATVITGHVNHCHGKILLPSLSGLLFKTNTAEDPAPPADVVKASEAQIGSDSPSGGDELSMNQLGGAADLVPDKNAVQELAEATLPSDQANAGVSLPSKSTAETEASQAAMAEVQTEHAKPVYNEQAAVATPVVEHRQLTKDDAANNAALLESVLASAETSWISKVSAQSATEALLPLVAMAPVLAAAGFHADVELSSDGPAVVRFPSIDHEVKVEDLACFK